MKSIVIFLLIFIASCKSEPSKDMVKFRLWAKQMDSLQSALDKKLDTLEMKIHGSNVRIDSNIFYDNNQPFIEDKGGYLFDTTINKKQEWLIDIPLLIDTGKVVEIWRRKLPDSPKYSTPI